MTRVSARYLAKRLLYSYVTVVAIGSLLFLFAWSRPGSIGDLMADPTMGPQQAAIVRERWAAGEPMWRQYLAFQANYQTGAFGRSHEFSVPVTEILRRRAPRTLMLFGSAFITGFIVGPLVGAYLGWHRGSRADRSVFAGSVLVYSMPSFWVGLLFVWLCWWRYDLLPRFYVFSQFPAFEWTVRTTIRDFLTHLALPLSTLVVSTWVGAMIVMRPIMINETNQAYVHLASAKGLTERTVMLKHAARNALIPVATQAIAVISLLIGGAVLIERVFAWPGLGDLLVVAVVEADYPLVFASLFCFGILVIVVRLLTDVAYTVLDPRIGFGQDEGVDSPSVGYPGGTRAVWGATGYVAGYLLTFPVAIDRGESLLRAVTVSPFEGNSRVARQFDQGPVPLTDFLDPGVVSEPELAGALFFNAQLAPIAIPIEVLEVESGTVGPGITSVTVNLLFEVGGATLLLLLVPPAVYAASGALATRGLDAKTPTERGLNAGMQFTGCVPLAVVSVFLFAFTGPSGPASPSPLFAVVFGGVLYPAGFGFLGASLADWLPRSIPGSGSSHG